MLKPKRQYASQFGPPSPMAAAHRRHRGMGRVPRQDLTEGPILSKLIKFCIPVMLTGMLQLLYNATDMVVLGQFASDTAVGAVGSCGALINLIVNLFFGLSVGVSVAVAQFSGAKREQDVKEVVHTAFLLSLIGGIVVGALGIFIARPALLAMGTLPETLNEAIPYMQAYMAGIPGLMVYNYLAAALRAKGDTVRPLIFLSISGLSNVLLNLWMVLGFGMGTIGVGIATAASQYLAAIMIVVYMFLWRRDDCRLSLPHMKIHADKVWLMLKVGIPAGLQGMLFSLSNVIIQSSINSFGSKALVDGNAAASNIEGLVYTAMNSVYQGAVTFVGQHVGAKKYDRLNRVILCCMGLVTVVGLGVGYAVLALGNPLLHFYVSAEAAVAAGKMRLLFITTTYFLCGLMDVGCGILRGMGKTFLPMIISLAGACGLRVLWIYTVFAAFPSAKCLYLSYPVSWTLTAAAHYLFVVLTKRKMQRLSEAGQAASLT